LWGGDGGFRGADGAGEDVVFFLEDCFEDAIVEVAKKLDTFAYCFLVTLILLVLKKVAACVPSVWNKTNCDVFVSVL
jgi:hypothetical protein